MREAKVRPGSASLRLQNLRGVRIMFFQMRRCELALCLLSLVCYIRELCRDRACPGQAQAQVHAQALPQALHASRLTAGAVRLARRTRASCYSSYVLVAGTCVAWDRTAAPAIELVPDAATSATLASSSLWQLVFAVRNALRHQRHCRAGRWTSVTAATCV